MNNSVDELILNRRRYISAKRAAETYSYAKDYIGQLCREGRIESVRVGRNWYVEEASILEHQNTNNLIEKGSENRAGGNSRKVYISPNLPKSSANLVKNSMAVYTTDQNPLLPRLKRVKSEEINTIPIRIEGEVEREEDVSDDGAIPWPQVVVKSDLYKEKGTPAIFTKLVFSTVTAIFVIVSVFSLIAFNSKSIITVAGSATNYLSIVYNTSMADKKMMRRYEIVAKEINKIVDESVRYIFYEF